MKLQGAEQGGPKGKRKQGLFVRRITASCTIMLLAFHSVLCKRVLCQIPLAGASLCFAPCLPLSLFRLHSGALGCIPYIWP